MLLVLDNKAGIATVLLVNRRTGVYNREIGLVPNLGSGEALLSINEDQSVVLPGLDGTKGPGNRRVRTSGEGNIRKSVGGGERGVAISRGRHQVGGDVEAEAENKLC